PGTAEALDAIGAEARPVLIARDDDRRLQIAERHDVVTRLGVKGDVDLLVGDALLLQRLVGGVALHACRLGVHGDGHLRYSSWNERDIDWQLIWYYVSLRFSDPSALKIPAVRGALPTRRGTDSTG